MKRPFRNLRLSIMLVLLLSGIAVLGTTTKSTGTTQPHSQNKNGVVYAAILPPSAATISQAVKSDTSPPLRNIPVQPRRPEQRENDNDRIPNRGDYNAIDRVRQSVLGPLAMPTPIVTWDGMYNQWGPIPPDTVGDVGLTQYVQLTNSTGMQVYNKTTGASILGPINLNTLWFGFGGLCETYNNG